MSTKFDSFESCGRRNCPKCGRGRTDNESEYDSSPDPESAGESPHQYLNHKTKRLWMSIPIACDPSHHASLKAIILATLEEVYAAGVKEGRQQGIAAKRQADERVESEQAVLRRHAMPPLLAELLSELARVVSNSVDVLQVIAPIVLELKALHPVPQSDSPAVPVPDAQPVRAPISRPAEAESIVETPRQAKWWAALQKGELWSRGKDEDEGDTE